MTLSRLDHINYYNVLAMLAAACLAVIIPFELVLLSYAILGPGHYLTEISWLKGRQFFTPKKNDFLIIIAVVLIALLLKLPAANIVFYAFGVSFIILLIRNNINRALAFIVLIIAGYFLLTTNLLRTVFGLYLPTLIHIYVFTGAFLLHGALKIKRISGYISLAVFIICPLLLCVLFTNYYSAPTGWAMNMYHHFAILNTTTLRSQSINVFTNKYSIILTRFIAFAYTYHYINWFSKIRVINWHQIPANRAIIIGIIWAASIALYFYNYKLGIRYLFILSFIHVILEFPLNHHSFMGISRELRIRLFSVAAK